MTNCEIDTTPIWQVILRWILFLPASVLGNIAADSLCFNLSSWNLGHLALFPTVLPVSLINFLQSSLPIVFGGFAGGTALIVIGAAVAPRFRTAVSLALLVLNTCVFSLVIGASLLGLPGGERPLAPIILEFVGTMAGIVSTFYFVARRVGWESNAPISRLWRAESSVE